MKSCSYFERFLEEFDYQKEAKDAYLEVAKTLKNNSECLAMAERASNMLFERPQNTGAIIDILASVAEKIGLPSYTVSFYIFALSTERLRGIWANKGMPDSVIYDSLKDFRVKSDECFLLTGIYGSYSDGWLIGWFRGERFAFGRLQFEMTELSCDEDVAVGGRKLVKGDKVIGIHISRSADSFSPEARLEAYKMAYNYFAPAFSGKEIPFTCDSWLLFPYNKKILEEGSNTVRFANEFKLLRSSESNVWIRFIFGVVYNGDPDSLPERTQLQRGYKEYIKKGNKTGSGYGIFIFDGDHIINA